MEGTLDNSLKWPGNILHLLAWEHPTMCSLLVEEEAGPDVHRQDTEENCCVRSATGIKDGPGIKLQPLEKGQNITLLISRFECL